MRMRRGHGLLNVDDQGAGGDDVLSIQPAVDLNKGFYTKLDKPRCPVTRQRIAAGSPLLPKLEYRGRVI